MTVATIEHGIEIADQACVWMRAGVLGYRLCDRDFDCEHCPLDAALRGSPWVALGTAHAPRRPGAGTLDFPPACAYGAGHTWLAPIPGAPGEYRCGLDSLAAALLGCVRRLRRSPSRSLLEPGEPLCALELEDGTIEIAPPVPCRIVSWNVMLADDPGPICDSPYGAGWIAEVIPAEPGAVRRLSSSVEAARRARLDARRFCRNAALQLLLADGKRDDAGAERRGASTDIRRILGASRYLRILGDIVH